MFADLDDDRYKEVTKKVSKEQIEERTRTRLEYQDRYKLEHTYATNNAGRDYFEEKKLREEQERELCRVNSQLTLQDVENIELDDEQKPGEERRRSKVQHEIVEEEDDYYDNESFVNQVDEDYTDSNLTSPLEVSS